MAIGAALTAAAALAAAPPDGAPEPPSAAAIEAPESPDIVVTARRRQESAQDVPIALSVLGTAQLDATGTFALSQVQQLIPALQIVVLNPKNSFINVRGFGSNVAVANNGIDNGVGVYIDQVYYPRVSSAQFDLVDLERIEVLRGPQGTLFGRNTTAGAINITSRAPSFTPDFTFEANVGDYDYLQVRATASAPFIGDSVAFRISGAITRRNGFIDNLATGETLQNYDNQSLRGQLLIKPNGALSLRLIADYSNQDLRCCGGPLVGYFIRYDDGTPVANSFLERIGRAGYVPPPLAPFARRVDADVRQRARQSMYGFSGQADLDLGGATLTAITAYRALRWDPVNDVDATPLPVFTDAFQGDRQKQFSQEVRLASNGERTLDYVLGVYCFRQIVRGYGEVGYGAAAPNWFLPALPASLSTAALSGFHTSSFSNPETKGYAAFGESTWRLTDRLALRFTHEDKQGRFEQVQDGGANLALLPPALAGAAQAIRNGFSANQAFTAKRSDDSLSGKLTLSYKAAPDILLYASYARGAKSGGLNLTAIPATVPRTVRPEQVDSYETGLKSELFDRTLTLNLAAYWIDISDYQTVISEQLPGTVTPLSYLANIPSARSRGIEGDAVWSPVPTLSFSASAAFTDATYRSYLNGPAPVETGAAIADLSGRRLAGVSRFAYTLGADLARPIGAVDLYSRADWSYRSSFYTAVSDSRFSRVPAYGLLNLRIGVRDKMRRWDIAFWARNLLDKDYFQALSAAATGVITGTLGDPRTVGATLRTTL